MSTTSAAKKESVWDYPRPPALEPTSRRLRVVWNDGGQEVVLADTTSAYRVLETRLAGMPEPALQTPSDVQRAPSHPPTYYIPPSDVNTALLTKNSKHSFCEWKGVATYFDIKSSSRNGETIKSRIWTYQEPSKRFKDIKDYFSFYAGPWDCYVDDEKVKAQPGDFYGGWMTSDIDGGSRGVKGGPGTWGW